MEVVLDRISNYRAIIVIALPAVAVQLNLDVIGSKGFYTLAFCLKDISVNCYCIPLVFVVTNGTIDCL